MRPFARKNQTTRTIASLSRKAVGKSLEFTNRFKRDESGTFATIFGVSTLAMFMAVGAAVDYSQISRSRSIVNQSLDAAVLAAGNDLLKNDSNEADLRDIFEDHLYANLDLHGNLSNKVTIQSFSVDKETGKINANLKTPVQTAFMGIIGVNQVDFDSTTEATFSTTPIEISMVLDVTGSMQWDGKIDSLKSAANKAVDILLPQGASNNYVKVGLVPYSEGVRLPKGLAKKASGQNTYTCMTERAINKLNDVSYTSEYVGYDDEANCSGNKIRALTNDGGKLKQDIGNLTTGGYTAGHLGIAWGYYMLSAKWQNFWKGASKPDDYGTKTRKVAILMTDGEFNTYFQGVSGDPTGPQQVKSANDAKGLCNDMKKAGRDIEIYSIAFNAPTSAKQVLQSCATADTPKTQYYYDANSQAELETAFVEIAKSIKSLRLSK